MTTSESATTRKPKTKMSSRERQRRDAQRALNDKIKKIAYDCGWEIWRVFSDKRRNGRRIKYMRNGWFPADAVMNKIVHEVNSFLKTQGLEDTHAASWDVGDSPGRGLYPYVALHIKGVPK
jgi:hypothetical protein